MFPYRTAIYHEQLYIAQSMQSAVSVEWVEHLMKAWDRGNRFKPVEVFKSYDHEDIFILKNGHHRAVAQYFNQQPIYVDVLEELNGVQLGSKEEYSYPNSVIPLDQILIVENKEHMRKRLNMTMMEALGFPSV